MNFITLNYKIYNESLVEIFNELWYYYILNELKQLKRTREIKKKTF